MTQRYVERKMDLGLVKERACGVEIGRVIGVVFLLAGLGVAGWGVVLLREAQASSAWPSVTGRVADVRVESNTRKGKTRFKPIVRYEYEVDGRAHVGGAGTDSGHGRFVFDAGGGGAGLSAGVGGDRLV